MADNRTKQWAFDFKVNGTVRSLAWTPDSRYLLASGGDSQVYTWDLRASRCRACWNNDGGTPTSSMAVSPPMASSGVVGEYKMGTVSGPAVACRCGIGWEVGGV